jgi:hypothetical protein
MKRRYSFKREGYISRRAIIKGCSIIAGIGVLGLAIGEGRRLERVKTIQYLKQEAEDSREAILTLSGNEMPAYTDVNWGEYAAEIRRGSKGMATAHFFTKHVIYENLIRRLEDKEKIKTF